ncbi:MAG: PQQ-binding-like beta-propeller repeat protein [Verrucomicrobiales bacterium]|nr:PQQ-binding-like beta-propeller repeat protein [Verrucomicrobiales bacterium]
MNHRALFLPAAAVAAAAVVANALAADWPEWGGSSSRNMVSKDKVSLEIEPGKKLKGKDEIDPATTKGLRWEVKLGSQAYGTPVVANGRVLVGTNNENPRDSRIKNDRGVLLCLDEKTGEMKWQFASPKLGTGKVSDWEYLGMCNTGQIEGNRIYMVTNRCTVVCLDLDGLANGNDGPYKDEIKYLSDKENPLAELGDQDADIIWLFDMREECGVFPHNVTSSSVMVVGDKVFANTSNGQDWTHTNIPAPNAPNLVMLDKATGKLLGEESSGISSRCMHGSWSSPALAKVNGEDVIVFGASDGFCYGFSTKTKKNEEDLDVLQELWRVDCNPKEYRLDETGTKRKYSDFNGPSEVIATPISHNNKVYVHIGQDPEHQEGLGMLTCLDPSQKGDLTGKVLWTYKDISRSISTAAIADGVMYVADFSGRLHALDPDTGKRFWLYDTKGHIWASPMVVDGKVLIPNEEGELHVLKAGKELVKEKIINFPGPIYSTPVVANDNLYIMTMSHLYSFGIK